ncbi:MAG: carboxypeptidase-like regulatory domain-containing protein [Vicinamibacteraceae bacterium]
MRAASDPWLQAGLAGGVRTGARNPREDGRHGAGRKDGRQGVEMRIYRMLWAVGVVLGLASSASAQLATQTALVGTVTDADGLVVPGATVMAVNVGTKDTYETITNEQGYYNIQFVRIGTYEISITLSGFQTFRAAGITVAGNQIVRTDATLRVGGLTDEVTIQAGAAVLATESAAVSETINRRAVADLPLGGRNVWNLASTTPGQPYPGRGSVADRPAGHAVFPRSQSAGHRLQLSRGQPQSGGHEPVARPRRPKRREHRSSVRAAQLAESDAARLQRRARVGDCRRTRREPEHARRVHAHAVAAPPQ